jgi:6-phosphogluconolactonase/glucosamine-6-phosphate isomerase/deaminase
MDVDRRATSRRNIICWSCGEAGHIANNCPKTLTTQLRMMTKEQRDTLLAEVDFTDEEKDESEAEVVRQTEVVIPNKKGF